jgi:hypothetical protein
MTSFNPAVDALALACPTAFSEISLPDILTADAAILISASYFILSNRSAS